MCVWVYRVQQVLQLAWQGHLLSLPSSHLPGAGPSPLAGAWSWERRVGHLQLSPVTSASVNLGRREDRGWQFWVVAYSQHSSKKCSGIYHVGTGTSWCTLSMAGAFLSLNSAHPQPSLSGGSEVGPIPEDVWEAHRSGLGVHWRLSILVLCPAD
jgi:hypothetical protein